MKEINTIGMVNGDIIADLQLKTKTLEEENNRLKSAIKSSVDSMYICSGCGEWDLGENCRCSNCTDEWISIDNTPDIGVYYVYIKANDPFQAIGYYNGVGWYVRGFDPTNTIIVESITHYAYQRAEP